MDLLSTSQTIAIGAGAKSAKDAKAAKGVLNSDFETFIRMLTTQMQNQDPLNPIESTDFATQLATFSSVEQQVLTNDLLTSLGAQMGALNLSQLSGWVGMSANAVMPVEFDGNPITLRVEGVGTAQTHQLVVRDESDAVVSRTDISGAAQTLDWRGHDAFGGTLPHGRYQIDVESFSQGQLVATRPAQVSALITEARVQNGQTILVFEGGQEVASDGILALKRSSLT
ncbi:flagellar hook capping FlgD N-terminal domain-containing protein [Roseovarius aestuariivivens]|uniref:flagellar hook capping FlgD N-terminal domain-containing protein n=1 Tax=Roseovarius aestuariivivens TaxID=1888910 RepID=UPI001080F7E7|nr:flagellar hook capping FlgD N-terminal domain-containing protein [Roseovarius aestuariivivens]